MILKFLKSNYLLILILVVSAFLHFSMLSSVPSGFSHDELEYLNNGFSLWTTGRDLYGEMKLTTGGVGYVALPAYISALPAFFVGSLSPQTGRLMIGFMGVIETLLIYLFTAKLFDKKSGLFAAAIFSISPWGLMAFRMMFDPPVSGFFFLLAITLAIFSKSIRSLLLSLVVLIFGLFSYYGAIFIFPFVFLILVWFRKELVKNIYHVVAIVTLFVISLLLLWLTLHSATNSSQAIGRSGEAIFNQTTSVSAQVVYDRSMSGGPKLADRLFINKATTLSKRFLNNYLGAFSPLMIFVNGDPQRIYGLWDHGELNILDLLLVAIGVFILIRKYTQKSIFLLLLLLVAPITSGLTSPVYATRSFLIWPILIIIAGVGSGHIISLIKKYFAALFILAYLFVAAMGIHQYFFRYPIYASEIWVESERQLADYLGERTDQQFVIYAPEARQMFMEYIFYNGFDPAEVQSVLDKNNILGDINYRNLTFINSCPDTKLKVVNSLITHHTCYPDKKDFTPLITASDRSSRAIWYISSYEK